MNNQVLKTVSAGITIVASQALITASAGVCIGVV